ncbi:MAG: type IV pilus twitching motility protein PilT [Porticoccaceae bacterium]
MEISHLLEMALEARASDLHLSTGLPPILRIDGEMQTTTLAPLEQSQIKRLVYGFMSDRQIGLFEKNSEIDLAWELSKHARFRINIFKQHRGITAVFRAIPLAIPTLAELGLGGIYQKMTGKPRGLILITGASGCGKSTTLAAMIKHINDSSSKHIITLEDPIEFLHASSKSLVSQRQIGRDATSFDSALRSAMREDPDVIMVGEMRDLETVRMALSAAETGHLVLATLHTSGAAASINRIIDMFPADERQLVRSMLAESLQAVASQTLLRRKSGGRVVASEITVMTSAIKNLIRSDRVAEIYSALQTGAASGMTTMDQSLSRLVGKGVVSREITSLAQTSRRAS